jgi:hypothetical protein
MQIYIYTGPTLTHAEGKELVNAHFQPPIKHGDILNAIDEGADCLVIIDGYYDSMPACRHKEILHALRAGIRVMGSSSMGAMRAAELDLFGMEGIGDIYQMYKSGVIDGDDEVAIKHAPESEGYRQLSLPLVNLRYNLQQMLAFGTIAPAEAELLIDCAKQMYFGARNLRRIFNNAKERGLSTDVIERCQHYFQDHWHDAKKADAKQLLKIVDERMRGQQPWPELRPPQVNQTNFLYRWTVDQARVNTRLGFVREQEVLAQFKFFSDDYPRIRQQANEKAWLRDYAERLNIKVSSQELQEYQAEFSTHIENLTTWLVEHNLSQTQWLNYLQTELAVNKLVSLRATTDRTTLLLEYTDLCGLSSLESELFSEWQKFYQEIKTKIFDPTRLSSWLSVDISVPPPVSLDAVPELSTWCQQQQLSLSEIKQVLGQRNLLRKLALNFYISPGIVYREPIMVELKIGGMFQQALTELLAIYDAISHKGISSDWHPQWKMFVQSDIRIVLQWFCKKRQLQPKIARDFIKWKGFDDFMEFVDVAQLNYIANS